MEHHGIESISSFATSPTTTSQLAPAQSSNSTSFYVPTPSNTPDFFSWLAITLLISAIITGVEAYHQFTERNNETYFRWAFWWIVVLLGIVFLPILIVVFMARLFSGHHDASRTAADAGREEEGMELEDMNSSD